MAIFDARVSREVLDATDTSLIDFQSIKSAVTTSFIWKTIGGDRVDAYGTGFTFASDGQPTGGHVTSLRFDVLDNRSVDAMITGITVPLVQLLAGGNTFWKATLGGSDTIYAPTTRGATLFGDFLSVIGSAAVIGGQDTIVGGLGQGQNLYGDADVVGQQLEHGNRAGELTAGRDTIIANNIVGTSVLVGDARLVESTGKLTANADILTGSDVQGDTIIGDAQRVFDSVARGANDTINGRGGNDLLIGDFKSVERFPGSTNGPSAAAFHDLINGGAGNDTIIGDVESNSNAGVSAIIFVSAGNDRLNGDADNDVIYGDVIDANDGLTQFGRDNITGGAGDDELYGDAKTYTSTLLVDVPFYGNDVIRGGDGADFIDGGVNDDMLYGDAGLDTLVGSWGNDVMTGGADADTFRFLADPDTSGGIDSGLDRLLDFTDDVDQLEISSAYGYADAAAVVATASVSGASVTINLNADSKITLVGYGLAPSTLLDDIVII